MSSRNDDDQKARKERDKRTLQRATIGVGVAALGLAGVLTYAASVAHVGASNTNPAPASNPVVVATPTSESDDYYDNPRPPATTLTSPDPRIGPVAVTGAS